jgi:hypothetical protein
MIQHADRTMSRQDESGAGSTGVCKSLIKPLTDNAFLNDISIKSISYSIQYVSSCPYDVNKSESEGMIVVKA